MLKNNGIKAFLVFNILIFLNVLFSSQQPTQQTWGAWFAAKRATAARTVSGWYEYLVGTDHGKKSKYEAMRVAFNEMISAIPDIDSKIVVVENLRKFFDKIGDKTIDKQALVDISEEMLNNLRNEQQGYQAERLVTERELLLKNVNLNVLKDIGITKDYLLKATKNELKRKIAILRDEKEIEERSKSTFQPTVREIQLDDAIKELEKLVRSK